MAELVNERLSERELLARLRGLPREREPRVDLWPGIEARIAPVRFHRWAQAAAAMLVAALGLAVMRLGIERVPDRTPMAVSWQVGATGAELEYSGALRDMRGLDFVATARMPTSDRTEVVNNLELVDEATRQVRAALMKSPDSGYLTAMLASLHRTRLGVLRDLALSSEPAEADDADGRA